eukprot:TRINITY_DN64951_c0_g1_i1.p1 TRINITY_DN64951_c0_g1~~TRINITY_DN64951_c0_g1_i1.p1  ORF type:complete len:476 (+),score=61.11 TRINITY_DN64951_c0_g1_i1:94-1521(+)
MEHLREPLLQKTLKRNKEGRCFLARFQAAARKGSHKVGIVLQDFRLGGMSAKCTQIGVAAIAITFGVLHPLATESSKTSEIVACHHGEKDQGLVCQGGAEGHVVRRVMPFHPVTLSLIAQIVSVVIALVWISVRSGSLEKTLKHLFCGRAMLRLLPVGAVYGLGDFLQTIACNAASAPSVLVVGQSKLLLSAILSYMILGKSQKSWMKLVIISCAAAASTELSIESAAVKSLEMRGVMLALGKATLSSAGAVMSEALYKEAHGGYWVVAFRLQFCMLLTSIMLLPLTVRSMDILIPSEFFFGGPSMQCDIIQGQASCMPNSISETCTCATRRGWDAMTLLAVLSISLNGFVTGLTLKYLSAVCKSVCNAMSSGAFYICYVLAGFRAFSLAQVYLLTIVVISSLEYAMEKATAGKKTDLIADKEVEKPSTPTRSRGGSYDTPPKGKRLECSSALVCESTPGRKISSKAGNSKISEP